jgi:hypothetical protein
MRAYYRRYSQLQLLFLSLAVSLILASAGCTSGALAPALVTTVTGVAVSPGTASIAVGATQQFTATATYSDGSTADVTSTATWTTSNTADATVDSSGMSTGAAAGSSTITAALRSVSGTAALSVTAATKTIAAISVTPATASIAARATEQFTATATYSDSSTANVTTTATWNSSNIAVATASSSGLATGASAGSSTITASLSGVSGTAALSVTAATKTITAIAVSPNPASIAIGTTQQFTATATYSDGSTGNVTTTAPWASASGAIATINSSGLATATGTGSTTVTATQSGVSGSASLTVTAASSTGVNITTFHVDANRSGLNANETILTPSNVSSLTFGKLFSDLVDGYVYGTPLIMSDITVSGASHDVLYVATEHDTVYAFDADTAGAPLWQTPLLRSGETPITDGPIQPYQGVTSTPVIDPTTNTIYVVSTQTSSSAGSTFRLNALDITTGAQKFGGPITISASVPGTNSDASQTGNVDYLTTSCVQRAALLLENGSVYIGFGGCHAGWLLQYDAATLAQTGKFDMSPDNNGVGPYASAGGVWMGAGGPVADSNGNIYITSGNGPFAPTAVPTDPPPTTAGAWADSVLRFNPTPVGGMLVLEDYFTPHDYVYMDCDDSDLAAGGLLLIPGTSPAQLVAGGKMGKLYFVDSTNLGREQTGDTGAIQTLEWGAAAPGQSALATPYLSTPCPYITPNPTATINSFEIFGTSAYFNGSIYLGVTPTNTPGPPPGDVPSGIRQFTYSNGQWVPGTDTTQYIQENTREATPFISANGTSDGILWMIDQGQPLQTPASSGPTNATLRVYEASNLWTGELYDSNQNGTADMPGLGIKFSSPVVANGKVYMSTGHDPTTTTNPQGEIDVYGLN